MRRAFSFGSMYLGSSPFDSPGTYSLLQWTETVEGIWYPKGGFHQVVQSLVDIAQYHEGRFYFDTPVSHVRVDPTTSTANGLVLADGKEVDADLVIVNADLAYAHANLFRGANDEQGTKRDPQLAKKLEGKPHSCSSISFYWAMDRKITGLNAHNIFLAEEYQASFDDIFKYSTMPREPSFYVNVPSRIDETASPEGKDAIVVLVPVGHLILERGGDGQDWDALVGKAKRQVVKVLEKRLGFENFESMIVWEDVNTPLTCEF